MRLSALWLLLAVLGCVGSTSIARAPAPRYSERHATREADDLIRWLYDEKKAETLLKYPVKVAQKWPSYKHDKGHDVVYAATAVTFDADGWVTLYNCWTVGVWDSDENGKALTVNWITEPSDVRLRPKTPVKTLAELAGARVLYHRIHDRLCIPTLGHAPEDIEEARYGRR